jgi:hypothetical protein
MNQIMKINLVLKANVEWHCQDAGNHHKWIDSITWTASLASIVASLFNIFCH